MNAHVSWLCALANVDFLCIGVPEPKEIVIDEHGKAGPSTSRGIILYSSAYLIFIIE